MRYLPLLSANHLTPDPHQVFSFSLVISDSGEQTAKYQFVVLQEMIPDQRFSGVLECLRLSAIVYVSLIMVAT